MLELRRSTGSTYIAGVAAGLARYFNTTALLLRLFFIISAFWFGTGLLIYVILWIGLPSDLAPARKPKQAKDALQEANKPADSRGNALATGLVLIALGLLFLLEKWLSTLYFDRIWPLFLVVLGILLLFNSGSPTYHSINSKSSDHNNPDNQESTPTGTP